MLRPSVSDSRTAGRASPRIFPGSGKLSDFGGRLRIGVHFAQGEIPKDESQTLFEMLLHLLHDGIGASAVWALVVAVLHQRDLSILGTLRVVFRRHRDFQCRHGYLA